MRRLLHPKFSRRRWVTIVLAVVAGLASTSAAATGQDRPPEKISATATVFAPADRLEPPVDFSPSGQPAPRGDTGQWSQVFVDDFEANAPLGAFPGSQASRFRAYEWPWRDTSGKGIYAPDQVLSVDDGLLRKHIRTEGGTHLVSAVVPKIGSGAGGGQLYGRYSVRFRADPMPGYKVVWLLWPTDGTNITGSSSGRGGNGEIDFPEMDLDDRQVSGFVHHQDATSRSDQYWTKADIDVTEWHTYTIEWSPNLVRFLLDGAEVGRTTERIPNTPMRFVLQTETSLRNRTDASTNGHVEIDWVSIWKYGPA